MKKENIKQEEYNCNESKSKCDILNERLSWSKKIHNPYRIFDSLESSIPQISSRIFRIFKVDF